MRERLAAKDSPLTRIDARVRIVAAVMLATVIAIVGTVESAVAGLFIGLVLVILARIPVRVAVRGLIPANVLFLFLCVSLAFTYPGERWYALSTDGLARGGFIAVKGNAVLLTTMALLSAGRVAELAQALRSLGIPRKIVLLLAYTYRQLFIVADEFGRLRDAARARCFAPGMNLHTYRTYAYLVGQTVVRAYDRAERVQRAMVARGFQGTLHTLTPVVSLRPRDLGAGVVALGVALALLVLDVGTP